MGTRGRKAGPAIEPIGPDSKITLKELTLKYNELVARVNGSRSRAQREMTEEDALRVVVGDLSGLDHGDAAERAGLSYGQVYSARKGATFKHLQQRKRELDMIAAGKDPTA